MDHKRKKRNLLINPRFQIKFSLLMCLAVALSTAAYPWIIYEYVQSVKSSLGEYADFEIPNEGGFVASLIIFQTLYLLFVAFLCIFFSHRVAGPLSKTKQYLSDLREGKSEGTLSFRKGDYFPEIADEINLTIDHFHHRERNKIEEIDGQLLKAINSENTVESLNKIRTALKQSS